MGSQSRLIRILLVLAGVLVLVAAASGAIYWVQNQRHRVVSEWEDPVAAIQPGQIVPQWTLYPLAGVSELETIDAAVGNGDLETAYAILVFGLDLTDLQRIGRLVLLGRRFAEAGMGEKAALSYQQVEDIAVLSAELNQVTQAEALLAVGRGWAELGQTTRALAAYDQASLVAVRSPYLQMAHRRDLLSMLETAYRELGEVGQAQASRQLIGELDQETSPQPPAEAPESAELSIDTQPVSSAEVGALEEGRRQAALAVFNALAESEEPPADMIRALAEALEAEDAAKLGLYQELLQTTTQPSRRVAVHWQVIRWLMLKYQVAAGGLGLSVVPAWESQLSDIQSALSKAYEDLFFDYEDLVTGLPEASLVGPGSYEVRLQTVQAGRLGQYPNYPEQQLAEKLQTAAADLIAAGFVRQLYVDVEETGDGLRFFLSQADTYGQFAETP